MARRPTLALTALAALPLGLTSLSGAEWSRWTGLDIWNGPTAHAELRAAADLGRDLDLAREENIRRAAAGERVIDRLIAGDVSLEGAACELEALNRLWPDYMTGLRAYYPGATDRERFARSALVRVRTRLEGIRNQNDAVIDRLEAELASRYPPQ